MLDDFLARALLGGVGVAVLAGPLGSLIVWRRMAYFGATLAHSALLGVALGVLMGVHPDLGVLAAAMAAALLLARLDRQSELPRDTLLGIVAHASLAFGLIALVPLQSFRVDLMGYLFGDILAVGRAELLWIYGGGALVLATLARLWTPLLAITVHADLARVEGIPVGRVDLAFMLVIAVVVALAMKLVGILLIVSLLIIPAATARRFAGSPEAMAALASGLGVLAVVLGLGGSLWLDLPAGPAVVAAAALGFALSRLLPGALVPAR